MLDDVKRDLEAQISALDHELRIQLPKEIRIAVALGDLRENAEYKAALERQEFVRARLGQLGARLSQLATLDLKSVPEDRAAYGSNLTVIDLDTNKEIKYRLVMSEESDLTKGWISVNSPLGRGFVGQEEGDEVTVKTPGGTKRFSIESLQTLHHELNKDQ